MLGLCCGTSFSASCSEQGLLSCGAWASHCSGFSSCKAWALGRARFSGLRSCSSRALEHRLSSCGTRASLLRGMWDLSGSEISPCPLHWQADSLPRSQGSLALSFLTSTMGHPCLISDRKLTQKGKRILSHFCKQKRICL